MKTFLTLMQREWLQHRFGWTLLAGVPLALALVLLMFGQIQIDDDKLERVGDALPAMAAMVSLAAAPAVLFVILGATSLILVSGMARRDHQDRSIEFWLSLPTGHASSLATPLVTHLLLVPAAALVLGLAGGWLVSLVLVTRLAGFGAWLSLPWGDLFVAAASMLLRVLAGLPLALLWASPLILAQLICNAWFKRWGLPVLLLSFAVGGYLVDRWLGQGFVAHLVGDILRHAGQALVATGEYKLQTMSPGNVYEGLRQVPGWALSDLGGALRGLFSPLFAGCVLVSAGLFAALVDWRRRGAGIGG